MKVILQQDVAKLGKRFDVVTVPDGYGFNKLVPQGMAKPATPENLKSLEAQKAKGAATQAADSAAFADIVKVLTDKVIDVTVEANEDGKMYQALKAEDIVTAIAKDIEVTVPAEQIVIGDPIKQTGEHTVKVANGADTGSFTINVLAG
jgi:large subunit ribosomal protein L9